MHKLILSAPFGNWLQWPNCTSTLGTFTADYRGGPWYRLWRVLKTCRYYHGIGAFRNKLGLPNPGIEWLRERVRRGTINPADKILSISARKTQDWEWLLWLCANQLKSGWIELNVSCPNTGEPDESDYVRVFTLAATTFGPRAIVKLPPVGYLPIATCALYQGITSFHCCNTLPSPGGGISGAPLKLLSLQALKDVRAQAYSLKLHTLIGGGGVRTRQDAQDYLDAGATNVAVASTLFFPWRWRGVREMAKDLAESSRP